MARNALLVGVNDYKGISDLRGCINDVTNMRDILKTYLGFTNKDIRVLVDNRGTKKKYSQPLANHGVECKAWRLSGFSFLRPRFAN